MVGPDDADGTGPRDGRRIGQSYRLRLCLCWLLAGLASAALSAHGSARAADTRADAYVDSQVLDAVREAGEARVIVVMGDPALSAARARDWRKRLPANEELARRVAEAAPRFRVKQRYELYPFLAGRADEQGLAELAACPAVEAVYPDLTLEAMLSESGPLIGQPTAETAGYVGSGVGIAILDTGIDCAHPDLGGGHFPNAKVIGGYSVVDPGQVPADDYGHGTAVAGTAAGTGAIYRGMAPGAHLIAVKVLDASGRGTESGVIAGIEWCIQHRDLYSIRVINMSLGDNGEWADRRDCDAQPVGEAVADAVGNGIVVVAAAGNSEYAGGVSLPACASGAMAVGATYDASYDTDWVYGGCRDVTPSVDDIACFSNRGELLDVLAPGAIITAPALGGGYDAHAGTSLSAPHVAGAAALLFQRLGLDTSPEEVRARLKRTGVQIVDEVTGTAATRVDLARLIADEPASGPDLVVTQVAADSESGLVGDVLGLSLTVRNDGDSTSGPCTALLLLSANDIASAQDHTVASVPVPALPPGGSYTTGRLNAVVPDLMAREYRVAAYVDSSYAVPEWDETNNGTVGGGFVLQRFDAYVLSSKIPASMLKGQECQISVTMWNGGSAPWTADDGFVLKSTTPRETADWGVTEVPLPGGHSVGVGETVTFSFIVTAPAWPGRYPCHWRMAHGPDYFGELATGATTTQVLDDTMYGQWHPAVSGDWVAYMDYGGLLRDKLISAISVMHIPTRWTITLPDDLDLPTDWTGAPAPPYAYFTERSHRSPDVSGPWVTWSVDDRLREGDNPVDPSATWYLQVTAYDLEAPAELPRRIVEGDWDAALPAIDGHLIVWEDYRNDPDGRRNPVPLPGDNADIYLYDLNTEATYPICVAPGSQVAPRISADLVVWEDWRDATPEVQSDIYLYDLSLDTDADGTPNWRDVDRPAPDPAERRVTASEVSERYPDVSGTTLVWLTVSGENAASATAEVYLRDLDSSTAVALALDPATSREQPRIEGAAVTWIDRRKGQGDVYWCETVTGAGGPITAHWADEECSDISGDRIVHVRHLATVTREDPGSGLPRPWPVYVLCVQDMLPGGLVGVHTFPDVPSDFWAWQPVEAAKSAGIVAGYPDGLYHPELAVTRDQMAVYIARAIAGGDANVPDTGCGTPPFADVPCDQWARKYIQFCVSEGVVQGYEGGTYQPGVAVTRDQMAVYVARSIATPRGEAGLADYAPSDPRNFADVPDTFWAYKHIEYCVENGVVNGYEDGLYHPEVVVTRDQMAVYVVRAFDLPM